MSTREDDLLYTNAFIDDEVLDETFRTRPERTLEWRRYQGEREEQRRREEDRYYLEQRIAAGRAREQAEFERAQERSATSDKAFTGIDGGDNDGRQADLRYYNRNASTLVIDSTDRDTDLYPDAASFIIDLPREYRNVKSIRLTSTEFPNSNQTVSTFPERLQNSKIYWRNKEDDDNEDPFIYNVTLTDGNYNIFSLREEIETKMNGVFRRSDQKEHEFVVTLGEDTDIVTFRQVKSTRLPPRPVLVHRGDNRILFYHPNHGFKNGDNVFIRGFDRGIAGIPKEELNGEHVIILPDPTAIASPIDVIDRYEGYEPNQYYYIRTETSANAYINSDPLGNLGSNFIRIGKFVQFAILFNYSDSLFNVIGFNQEYSSKELDQMIIDINITDPNETIFTSLYPHGLSTGDKLFITTCDINTRPIITGTQTVERTPSNTQFTLRGVTVTEKFMGRVTFDFVTHTRTLPNETEYEKKRPGGLLNNRPLNINPTNTNPRNIPPIQEGNFCQIVNITRADTRPLISRTNTSIPANSNLVGSILVTGVRNIVVPPISQFNSSGISNYFEYTDFTKRSIVYFLVGSSGPPPIPTNVTPVGISVPAGATSEDIARLLYTALNVGSNDKLTPIVYIEGTTVGDRIDSVNSNMPPGTGFATVDGTATSEEGTYVSLPIGTARDLYNNTGYASHFIIYDSLGRDIYVPYRYNSILGTTEYTLQAGSIDITLVSVTAIGGTDNVTVTTSAPHGLSIGDLVLITGVTGNVDSALINSSITPNVVSAVSGVATFEITIPGTTTIDAFAQTAVLTTVTDQNPIVPSSAITLVSVTAAAGPSNVTVTTSAPHGLLVGDTITIAGVTGNYDVNQINSVPETDMVIVSTPSPTTFTITITSTFPGVYPDTVAQTTAVLVRTATVNISIGTENAYKMVTATISALEGTATYAAPGTGDFVTDLQPLSPIYIENSDTGVTTDIDISGMPGGASFDIVRQGSSVIAELTKLDVPSGGAYRTTGTASYFRVFSANDTTIYYVWYSLSDIGNETDPAIAGETGIEVVIESTDTKDIVALKTSRAMQSIMQNLDGNAVIGLAGVTFELETDDYRPVTSPMFQEEISILNMPEGTTTSTPILGGSAVPMIFKLDVVGHNMNENDYVYIRDTNVIDRTGRNILDGRRRVLENNPITITPSAGFGGTRTTGIQAITGFLYLPDPFGRTGPAFDTRFLYPIRHVTRSTNDHKLPHLTLSVFGGYNSSGGSWAHNLEDGDHVTVDFNEFDGLGKNYIVSYARTGNNGVTEFDINESDLEKVTNGQTQISTIEIVIFPIAIVSTSSGLGGATFTRVNMVNTRLFTAGDIVFISGNDSIPDGSYLVSSPTSTAFDIPLTFTTPSSVHGFVSFSRHNYRGTYFTIYYRETLTRTFWYDTGPGDSDPTGGLGTVIDISGDTSEAAVAITTASIINGTPELGATSTGNIVSVVSLDSRQILTPMELFGVTAIPFVTGGFGPAVVADTRIQGVQIIGPFYVDVHEPNFMPYKGAATETYTEYSLIKPFDDPAPRPTESVGYEIDPTYPVRIVNGFFTKKPFCTRNVTITDITLGDPGVITYDDDPFDEDIRDGDVIFISNTITTPNINGEHTIHDIDLVNKTFNIKTEIKRAISRSPGVYGTFGSGIIKGTFHEHKLNPGDIIRLYSIADFASIDKRNLSTRHEFRDMITRNQDTRDVNEYTVLAPRAWDSSITYSAGDIVSYTDTVAGSEVTLNYKALESTTGDQPLNDAFWFPVIDDSICPLEKCHGGRAGLWQSTITYNNDIESLPGIAILHNRVYKAIAPVTNFIFGTDVQGRHIETSSDIAMVADVADSLLGTYWIFYTTPTDAYYVWYDTNGTDPDPTPAPPAGSTSFTGLQIDIATGDPAGTVATVTESVLDSYEHISVFAGHISSITIGTGVGGVNSGTSADTVTVVTTYAHNLVTGNIVFVGRNSGTTSNFNDTAPIDPHTVTNLNQNTVTITVTSSTSFTFVIDNSATGNAGAAGAQEVITPTVGSIIPPGYIGGISSIQPSGPTGISIFTAATGPVPVTADGAVTTGFTFTTPANGRNPREIHSIDTIADMSGSLGGTYWIFYSTPTDGNVIWYNVSSSNAQPNPTAPSGVTFNFIEVSISFNATASAVALATKSAIDAAATLLTIGGATPPEPYVTIDQEISSIACSIGSSLATGGAGLYWSFNSTAAASYYVWYDTGLEVNPAPGGFTDGILVSILATDTAEDVATKTITAISAFSPIGGVILLQDSNLFGGTNGFHRILLINSTSGDVPNTSSGTAGGAGFITSTVTSGASAGNEITIVNPAPLSTVPSSTALPDIADGVNLNARPVHPNWTPLNDEFYFKLNNGIYAQNKNGKIICGGGLKVTMNSENECGIMINGYDDIQRNTLCQGQIQRPINLEGDDYVYLTSDILSTLDNTSGVPDVFAKILLSDPPGSILFNTFATNERVFSTPINSLNRIKFEVKYKNNELYDFNNEDYSFGIEIVEYTDQLVNTGFNSQRGIIDQSHKRATNADNLERDPRSTTNTRSRFITTARQS